MYENSGIDRLVYDEHLDRLTEELTDMARWAAETGQRIVVLFEGRDAAGKGETIDVISRTLSPRQCHVVALPQPTAREREQWYFQRYIKHIPPKGEITLFDRSWYNRAGVETVMGFCSATETETFLTAAPQFERHLVEDGVLLFKYWLACDQARQEERLKARRDDPRCRWNLNAVDHAARGSYDAYTDAREKMLTATHTAYAPWTIVDFNDQALGRLTLLRNLLDRIPDTALPETELRWTTLSEPAKRERYNALHPLPAYCPN